MTATTHPEPTAATLAAGRELDLAVARLIDAYTDHEWQPYGELYSGHMDFRAERECAACREVEPPAVDPVCDEQLDCYSTCIASAWDVVEHLRARGWRFTLSTYVSREAPGPWHCVFIYESHGPAAYGATAPEAICRAALSALAQGMAAP